MGKGKTKTSERSALELPGVLLSREEFKRQVFERDHHKCVVCGEPAVDAHHLMERRLFEDGGYRKDNGVSLCAHHHLKAEDSTISPKELRERAGITQVVLPEHLEAGYEYTKWGDIVLPDGRRSPGELFYEESVQKILKEGGVLDLYTPYVKYPRTPHVPGSPGATSDDNMLASMKHFEGKEVVCSLKMDGENSTLTRDKYYARSIDSKHHPSRNWLKKLHGEIAHEIPEGWRICGENMYAKHSIEYENLPSYFLVFAVFNEKNQCLSWNETKEWAELLNIETVPVVYKGPWDEEKVKALSEAKCPWSDVNEGYVVRIADSFPYAAFRKSVAKWVRKGHVQTDQHWMHSEIVPNKLAESNDN